ncbi:hypothetical protein F350042L8_25970 [Fusobacterium ulcerans]
MKKIFFTSGFSNANFKGKIKKETADTIVIKFIRFTNVYRLSFVLQTKNTHIKNIPELIYGIIIHGINGISSSHLK